MNARRSLIAILPLALVFTANVMGGTPGESAVSDVEITRAVVEELWLDDATDANRVDVRTEEGVVLISGKVDNLLAKDRAVAIAASTVGVRAIVDRLEVKPAVNRDDKGISEAVVAALVADPATEAYEVDVRVDQHGIVTLTGSVDSWREKQLCEAVAKEVAGVREIKNQIAVAFYTDRPDSELAAEARAYLANDVRVDDALINIEVKDSAVTLSGSVGSLTEKNRAINDVWTTGVRTVDATDLHVDPWRRDEMRRIREYTERTDEEITRAVTDAMVYDPRVLSFKPEVEVEDGTVILTGTVTNIMAKIAAEQDARNTLGVWRVKNYLKVQPEERVSDAELESRVRFTLGNDPYVELSKVKVTANGGRVRLAGTVNSSYEKERAELLAQRVRGVVAVTSHLDYTHLWEWRPDREIREDIAYQLFWSPFVDDDRIEFEVENGVVTLDGNVATWAERAAAEKNAWEGGAKDVRNGLTVTYPYYGPYYPVPHIARVAARSASAIAKGGNH